MTFPTDSPLYQKPSDEPLIAAENLRPEPDPKAKELARKTSAIEHIIALFYDDLDDQARLDEIWDTVEEFA